MVKISRILSICMILLGVYVIITASQFPPGTSGVLGPGFFPVFLGILLVALSFLLLLQTRKKSDSTSFILTESTKRVIISSAIILAYLVGINILGFLIATPIFLFSIMWYFTVRKKATLIIVSLAATGILYFVFLKLLSVSLPTGLFM